MNKYDILLPSLPDSEKLKRIEAFGELMQEIKTKQDELAKLILVRNKANAHEPELADFIWQTMDGNVSSMFTLSDDHIRNILIGGHGSDSAQETFKRIADGRGLSIPETLRLKDADDDADYDSDFPF